MSDCIFCKIVRKEIPAELAYEDEKAVAFKDLHPIAPQHYLVVPKEHVPGVNDVNDSNCALVGHLLDVAGRVAKKAGFAESGFRVIINTNRDAGQEIFHLHLHLLGGKRLGPMLTR